MVGATEEGGATCSMAPWIAAGRDTSTQAFCFWGDGTVGGWRRRGACVRAASQAHD